MKSKLLSACMLTLLFSISYPVFSEEIDCSNMKDKAACENLKKLLEKIERESQKTDDFVADIEQQMQECNEKKPLCDSGNDEDSCTFLKENCAGNFKGFEDYK